MVGKSQGQEIEGFVDAVEGRVVFGWCWNADSPDQPVELEVLIDAGPAQVCEAGLYRADLQNAGKGNGQHAFEYALPEEFVDGREHAVTLRERATGVELEGSPCHVVLHQGGEAAIEELDPGEDTPWPRFPGRFGGFWVDLNNARAVCDGKARMGWIDEAERELLERFMRDGFVVLEQAVPEDLIDRLGADVADIWHGRSSARCFAQVHEGDGRQSVRPFTADLQGRVSKVLDLYGHLESARQVIFAERILRFIALVFERPVTAFQGLYFEYGSQQEMHKDTAFVKVDSPAEFVASWIALEDIEAGTGELEYYRGSHRLPEFLFDGERKWMPPHSDQSESYYRFLHEESRKRDMPHEKFLARKGDVLIWHSELAHGGSRIEQPDRTRRSFVTHYCPSNCQPVYPMAAEVVRESWSPMADYTYPTRE